MSTIILSPLTLARGKGAGDWVQVGKRGKNGETKNSVNNKNEV